MQALFAHGQAECHQGIWLSSPYQNSGNFQQFHGAQDSIKNVRLKTGRGSALLIGIVLSGISFAGSAFAADVARMVEPCFSCHGTGGVSTEAEVPSIAGYSEDYLIYSLELYQKKKGPALMRNTMRVA